MKLVRDHQLSRQDCHEEIRVLSHQAAAVVKEQGGKNDLIERLKKTEFFKPIWGELDDLLNPVKYIGRSPHQVVEFVEKDVNPALAPYTEYIEKSKAVELNV